MAKLRSGILGNIRGKVAGVVGGQWKDVNYLREYVKPANPNTASQIVQRTAMSDVVTFCKTLVGPVFNAYTDKFQKSMSGFNRFIKSNIAIFDGTPDYTAIVVTAGTLYAPSVIAATHYPDDDEVVITWPTTLGNNGAANDAVYGVIYNKDTGLWYFPAAEGQRDTSGMTIDVPDGATTADFQAWLFFIKYDGTIVSLLSASVHTQAVDL